MIFEVYEKHCTPRLNTNKIVVYSVKNNLFGNPQFLIYKNEKWVWRSSKHFTPVCKNTLKG